MHRAIAIVLLVLLVGCQRAGLDGAIPIRGKVSYNGAPVTGGEIRYIPLDTGRGRVARGRLDQNGNFELTSLKLGDGALPGEYRIVVLAAADGVASAEESEADSEQNPEARALEQKMQLKQAARRVYRAADGQGPASQVPLRYTQPLESGLTDHVDANHSGYIEFNLSDK